MGYHLVEFEFVEINDGGSLTFNITTSSGEYAWIGRSMVCVPYFSDEEYEYTIRTTTYFGGDDCFLVGYADDFIHDISLDNGLLWDDWQWDMGDESIYAWKDGFDYRLGWQTGFHILTFTYGEVWGGGLIDFQYISWTHQRDRIGLPKFYTSIKFTPHNRFSSSELYNDTIEITDVAAYAGSTWKDPTHPGISEREFQATLRINASFKREWVYPLPSEFFDSSIEVGLGLTSAEWILSPGATNDLGITVNLTCLKFDTNRTSIPEGPYAIWQGWWLTLRNVEIEASSCQWIEIPGVEFYPNGRSIVKPDYTTAVDYTSTVIMFLASSFGTLGLISPITAIFGSFMALAAKGVAVTSRYYANQELEHPEETIQELHHRQLKYNDHIDYPGLHGIGPLNIPYADLHQQPSANEIAFYELNPISEKRCGLTKITLKGQVAAPWLFGDTGYPYFFIDPDNPLLDLEISIAIPWFT